MPEAAIASLIFLFGLCIGSFLNVVIRRVPAEQSIVRPASRCPKCSAPIKPWDNIPVLSYLILRGKCRQCRAPISFVYPLVELLTGLLFLACYLTFGLSLAALKWALFSALIIVLVFTDIFERILPDPVNFGGLAAGLLLSLFVPVADGAAVWLSGKMFHMHPPTAALSLIDAALGALIGSGILWIVGEGYFRLRGKEGMGLGDVKMMAMVGAFLGPKLTIMTILVGSLLGSVLGLIFILLFRKRWQEYELPFGTFLGGAALLVTFYGPPAMAWYVGLMM